MVNPAGEFQVAMTTACWACRRRIACCPTSPQHQMLSMAQAIWYMPQGLDVWDQLLCQFPGHYARDDKKCGQRPGGTDEAGNDRFDGPAWSARRSGSRPTTRPDREGSLEQRLQRLQTRIMEGDKQGAYKVALGLHAEPGRPARRALESQLLFCAIIDLQDTLQQRKLQNIRHKALRARALVSLARLVGWEQARPLLYCVVPPASPPVSPVRPLHPGAGGRFKNDLYTLKARNRSAMSPPAGGLDRDDPQRDGGGSPGT